MGAGQDSRTREDPGEQQIRQEQVKETHPPSPTPAGWWKPAKRARRTIELTDEEKKNARRTAIREAKRLLGEKLCKELRKRCGSEDAVLETYVEAEVAERKNVSTGP